MHLSQIKTLISGLVAISSLFATMSAFASSESAQRYSDNKNRPSSKTSTSSLKGGFSDGGGNYVGNQLFDFYENDGTDRVSVADLLKLEPLAGKVIAVLNETVPFTNGTETLAFGKTISNALGKKALYLESKKITAPDCLNTSSVGSKAQGVAACQGSDEVRFYLPWLTDPKVTAENRAGLIIHEMLLAWAFDVYNFHELDQEEMERRVRVLNRAIFLPEDSTPLAETIRKLFRVDAVGLADVNVLRNMRRDVGQISLEFCKDPSSRIKDLSPEYYDKPGYEKILNDYEMLITTKNILSLNNKPALNKKDPFYISFCNGAIKKYSPIRKPDLTRIPEACALQVKKLLRESRETIQQILSEDLDFYFDHEDILINSIASSCTREKSVELEVHNYFRFLAKEIAIKK